MAARRKLSDADRLAISISRAIYRSKCTPLDVVNALMAVAAGRAVVDNTHKDCAAFGDDAHAAFHAALKAVVVREKGDRLVN
jgi:hypothetical protein